MNNVIISGRLTADPELRRTPSDIPVCTFTVAVNRLKKEEPADFISVVTWRQTAEFVAKYFSKGKKIMLRGELRTRSYTDRTGAKRTITEVHADKVEFADGKTGEKPVSATAHSLDFSPENFDELDGDLPF